MEFPPVTYADWRRRVAEELGDAGFDETLVSRSESGLKIEPLYAADGPSSDPGDAATSHFAYDLDAAGADNPSMSSAAVFAEGLDRSEGDPARGWSLCQLYDRLPPDELRRQLSDDLDGGADGVWVRLGRRFGASSAADAPGTASSPIGAVQAADFEALETLGRLLAERNSGRLLVQLDAGHDALAVADRWLKLQGRRGSRGPVELSCGADPLAILAASPIEGSASVDRLYDDMASLALRCDRDGSGARAIVVSTLPYRAAGVDAVGELSCQLATLVDYLRRLSAVGMPIAAAAGQIGLRLAVGLEIFPAAAKLRAARRLWSHALSACGVEPIPAPHVHAVAGFGGPGVSGEPTGESGAGDPWIGALRSTTEVFAAIIGGADAITSLPGRTADGAANGPGRRLARNTQLVLAEESLLGRVTDPPGGSYFMEALTEEFCRAAWAEFQQIERRGGMAAALEDGWIADRLDRQGSSRRLPEDEG